MHCNLHTETSSGDSCKASLRQEQKQKNNGGKSVRKTNFKLLLVTNKSVNLSKQEMILAYLQFKTFHLSDSNLMENVFIMVIVLKRLKEERNSQTAICK